VNQIGIKLLGMRHLENCPVTMMGTMTICRNMRNVNVAARDGFSTIAKRIAVAARTLKRNMLGFRAHCATLVETGYERLHNISSPRRIGVFDIL